MSRERLPDCTSAHAPPHPALALGTFFPCFVQLLARRSLIAEIFVGAEQTESFSFDFVHSFHPHRNLLHLGFDDTALEEKWRAIATLLMTACGFLCFHAKLFSVSLLPTPPSPVNRQRKKGKLNLILALLSAFSGRNQSESQMRLEGRKIDKCVWNIFETSFVIFLSG